MPTSLQDPAVVTTLRDARTPVTVHVEAEDWTEPRQVRRPFPSPVDWRDHWIYFLMIDRFDNPDGPPRSAWDREAGGLQGGTLEGVRRRLPYLEDLGAGAIWVTPVLRNRTSPGNESHHGYGIMDFLDVDPRFGTEDDLERLVDEAHARGIRIILDVVINHAGDVFAYDVDGQAWDAAPWSDSPRPVLWRGADGSPRREWSDLDGIQDLPRDAGIWPVDLQRNDWFRRQGKGGPLAGDFETLKEFRTEQTDAEGDHPVWNRLIRAYQYIVARFDVDGFRIDTLRHVEREFALTFCNAMREFAISIGKENFFLFGETKSDDEELLAAYTGRFTSEEAGRFGADAALDFPLQWSLGPTAKGFAPPTVVEDVFARRRVAQRHLLSSHGEASRFFVTFLDNHDDPQRFLHPGAGAAGPRQLAMALGCLFALQGIPCLYYGTEQGLSGTREIAEGRPHGRPEHVREALWGKPGAFDRTGEIYRRIRDLAALRAREPALRYGRQYFRPVSGNGHDFGPSTDRGGVLAVSRILNDREVVLVANTSVDQPFSGRVLVDWRLSDDATPYEIGWSSLGREGSATPDSGDAVFWSRDGGPSPGRARSLPVDMAPLEAQVLVPA